MVKELKKVDISDAISIMNKCGYETVVIMGYRDDGLSVDNEYRVDFATAGKNKTWCKVAKYQKDLFVEKLELKEIKDNS